MEKLHRQTESVSEVVVRSSVLRTLDPGDPSLRSCKNMHLHVPFLIHRHPSQASVTAPSQNPLHLYLLRNILALALLLTSCPWPPVYPCTRSSTDFLPYWSQHLLATAFPSNSQTVTCPGVILRNARRPQVMPEAHLAPNGRIVKEVFNHDGGPGHRCTGFWSSFLHYSIAAEARENSNATCSTRMP